MPRTSCRGSPERSSCSFYVDTSRGSRAPSPRRLPPGPQAEHRRRLAVRCDRVTPRTEHRPGSPRHPQTGPPGGPPRMAQEGGLDRRWTHPPQPTPQTSRRGHPGALAGSSRAGSRVRLLPSRMGQKLPSREGTGRFPSLECRDPVPIERNSHGSRLPRFPKGTIGETGNHLTAPVGDGSRNHPGTIGNHGNHRFARCFLIGSKKTQISPPSMDGSRDGSRWFPIYKTRGF